jgi:hypothetical protein
MLDIGSDVNILPKKTWEPMDKNMEGEELDQLYTITSGMREEYILLLMDH